MTNRLIELLQKENNLTEKRLKAVFRRLCKETHPDMKPGRSRQFVALRRDYEEALSIIRGRRATPQAPDPRLREKILANLYQYCVKELTRESEPLLLAMIRRMKKYDAKVAALWEGYYREFYRTSSAWISDGAVFYAHGHLIAAIKQLFYFYSARADRHRRLFFNYCADLEKRVQRIDGQRAAIIRDIVQWLKKEIDIPGPKIV